MNPANDEKLTEKAWLAMGAALLRTAERNGAVLTDEARTQFQSAMTALAQADTEKSVCAALPATDEAVLEVWKAAGLLAEKEKAGTPLVLDRDEVRHRLYTSRPPRKPLPCLNHLKPRSVNGIGRFLSDLGRQRTPQNENNGRPASSGSMTP
mgnify:CR=1 FL=1